MTMAVTRGMREVPGLYTTCTQILSAEQVQSKREVVNPFNYSYDCSSLHPLFGNFCTPDQQI